MVSHEAGTANRRWSEMLARWAIHDELVRAAPASPYFFDPDVFTAAADEAMARAGDTFSDNVARDALPAGGTLLDCWCGRGQQGEALCCRRRWQQSERRRVVALLVRNEAPEHAPRQRHDLYPSNFLAGHVAV